MAPNALIALFPFLLWPSACNSQGRRKRRSPTRARCRCGAVTRSRADEEGPWAGEEDEILLDYIRRYSPRDWSTIRNKSLLPRTGKSCRLRYVNKLKPNLKSGCKFTAEERVVINSLAEIGNKWAKIATFLPGRTDNDAKNFWSTRRKRLARMLQSPNKHTKNKGKMQASIFDGSCDREASSSGVSSSQPLLIEQSEAMKMVQMPDLVDQPSINQEASSLPIYDDLHTSTVDLPLLPESHDFIPGLVDPGAMDLFGCQQVGMPETQLDLPADLPMFDKPEVVGRKGTMKVEGNFFDDLPPDMFDSIEPISNSSQFRNDSGGQ